MLVWNRVGLTVFFLGMMSLCGCGGGKTELTPEALAREKIQDVGTLLRVFATQNNRPPDNMEELDEFQNSTFDSFQSVKSGEIIVIWGLKMPGEGEKGTEAVAAYEKRVLADKGFVLLNNGNIVSMDAATLNTALKR